MGRWVIKEGNLRDMNRIRNNNGNQIKIYKEYVYDVYQVIELDQLKSYTLYDCGRKWLQG